MISTRRYLTNKIFFKTTKKLFTFDVSTSITGLHQKKLVLGLLPVLGATSMSRAKKAVVRMTEGRNRRTVTIFRLAAEENKQWRVKVVGLQETYPH